MIKNMKTIRLTEKELVSIVENTTDRILRESRDENEIKLAQKELCKMGGNLSSIGMRLEGTPFYKQYLRMKDDIISLNNALIDYIKRGKK